LSTSEHALSYQHTLRYKCNKSLAVFPLQIYTKLFSKYVYKKLLTPLPLTDVM